MSGEQRKKTTMMTEGVIWKQLIAFAVPLLIGNLLQQLYNTVDSIVVGQFIGSEALAAVSSSNSLINLVIGMFLGIATGAGVVISQYYGARAEEKMHQAVHTAIALCFIGGVILIVVGIGFSPLILKLMGTPEEVMVNSVVYFRIFFSGSLFNLTYNMAAGILRAVGDSRHPLYFLCVSSVTNIILDILFVVLGGMGVEGVAIATVISQFISMVLCLRTLTKTDDIYKLEFRKLRIRKTMVKMILTQGLPAGFQHSIISLSNVIVQANVNAYGAMAMAGFGSYLKIDGFAQLPMQSFCLAATTFTGQNIGAKKYDRVKKGIAQNLTICLSYVGCISLLLYIFAPQLTGIFSTEPEVVRYGTLTMRLIIPFYLILPVHQVLMGTMRGAGKTTVSMLISVGNMCVLRMIYINLLVPFFPSYKAVMLCYPITWIGTMTLDVLYILKGNWLPASEEKTAAEM
ncbi:MAG: MATE family efflux transporter [Lachnospiraceae bacterium]|nr:MATE family efflux transporter [Lachnospiraceae bacterium]